MDFTFAGHVVPQLRVPGPGLWVIRVATVRGPPGATKHRGIVIFRISGVHVWILVTCEIKRDTVARKPVFQKSKKTGFIFRS